MRPRLEFIPILLITLSTYAYATTANDFTGLDDNKANNDEGKTKREHFRVHFSLEWLIKFYIELHILEDFIQKHSEIPKNDQLSRFLRSMLIIHLD